MYVIVGLILVVSVFSIYFQNKNQFEVSTRNNIDFSSIRTSAKLYVDICLDQVTIRGVDNFGLIDSEEDISNFIDSSIINCLNDFKVLKDQGYNVVYKNPDSSVVINENIVFVDLHFPVTISMGKEQITIEDFQYNLKKSVTLETEDGVIKKGTTLYFDDEDFIFRALADTNVINSDNKPVQEIQIEIEDKKFNGLSNDVVIGHVIYDGTPQDIKFDPPVEVGIRIKKSDVPINFPAAQLKIGWFDEFTKIWRTYKSLPFKKDESYYYYSALVDHFTPIAVVACGVEEVGTYKVPMGYVYKGLIEPDNESMFWTNNYDGEDIPHDFTREEWDMWNGKGMHLYPEYMNYKDKESCVANKNVYYNLMGEDLVHEDLCSYEKGLLRDWDNDDDNNYEPTVKLNGDEIDSGDEYTFCIDLCSMYAKQTLMEQFSWIDDEDKYFSGDGIRDQEEINCESDSDDLSDMICLTGTESEIDNLHEEVKESVGDGAPYRTMEVYEITDDSKFRKGYFATPRTYGYGSMGDQEEIEDQVSGIGYYTFELADDGGSCIDTQGLESREFEIGFTWGSDEGSDLDTTNNDELTTCSDKDTCVWSVNNPEDFLTDNTEIKVEWPVDAVENKLRAGINVISVKVEENVDIESWANAHLGIKGKGLVKWDQCGVSVEDRLEFLCGCDGSCEDIDTDEYNCLNDVEDKSVSLCKLELVDDCAIYGFDGDLYNPNGGICNNGIGICPDIVTIDYLACLCDLSQEIDVELIESIDVEKAYCCNGELYNSIEDFPEGVETLGDCRQEFSYDGLSDQATTSEELLGLGGGGVVPSGSDAGSLDIGVGEFKEMFKGVWIKKVNTLQGGQADPTIPRPIVYHVVKIDLEQEGVGFFVTPGPQQLSVTSNFLSNSAHADSELGPVRVAINGDGFDFGSDNTYTHGIAVSNGKDYGKGKEGDSIKITQENEVEIMHYKQPPSDGYNIVSGFQQIAKNGEVIKRFIDKSHPDHKEGYDIKDPRTSIGYNEEDKELIIIVVDGRGESTGVDLTELAQLQIEYGADDAVNMDGGGSSTLVIDNNGEPAILNTPSDGAERAVANHLGIYAQEGTSGELGQGGGDEPDPEGGGDGDATLENFREVSNGIAAGAQPTKAGFDALAAQGYKTIIDTSGSEVNWEQSYVEGLGMKYEYAPLGIYETADALSGPANGVADLMANQANHPIYIHCQYGSHRTGVSIGLFRVRYEGWSYSQAETEMLKYAEGNYPYDWHFEVVKAASS